jgi:PBP1b-binding outer membrane lipoprotein LpoB
MKSFGIIAILLCTVTVFLTGCASQDTTASDQTAKSAVPGEKVEGDDRVTPGAGPNASVRW